MKNEQNTKAYLEKLKDMKLSDSSRARIQNNLTEYARFHGVRVGEDGRSIEQVPQRTSFFTSIVNSKIQTMTAAILIALMIGGGTSYAAEGAVPGDFLYPMKVEVNENIKSAFAVSNEAEARLQAKLAEERLEEAEELAARGELDAETSARIASRLEAHYREAEKRNSDVEASGNYEASVEVRTSLEGTLRAYADVITNLDTTVSGNESAGLVAEIRSYADATADARATATIDASVDAETDVSAAIERADNFVTSIQAKLDRAKDEISAEAHARIKASVDEAVRVQAEAKVQFEARAYRVAYAGTQTAMRLAIQAETMLNSALRIDIDLGGNDRMIDVEINSTNRATETEEETRDASIRVDVSTDAEVETEILDVKTESDTSVRSGAGISI